MSEKSKGLPLNGEFHAVEFKDAMRMTKKWQEKVNEDTGLNYVKSFTFSKEDFIQILNEDFIRYIRIYPCVEDDGTINLLAVGANVQNEDVINEFSEASGIYNFATPCPNTCGESPLNHEIVE